MNADAPVAVLLTVALSTQPVRLGERHGLAARKMQLVAVSRVVAVETPPMFRIVLQYDVVVRIDERPPNGIRGQIFLVVAVGTGEDPFGERGRGNLHPQRRRLRLPLRGSLDPRLENGGAAPGGFPLASQQPGGREDAYARCADEKSVHASAYQRYVTLNEAVCAVYGRYRYPE